MTSRAPAPRASEAIALTVRLSREETAEFDTWMLRLRNDTGARLDKAEVIRELLRMARAQDSLLHDALVHRLHHRTED